MNITGPNYTLPKTGVRTLHVEGVEYLYSITRSHVIYYLPTKKIISSYIEVTGEKSWDGFEKGQQLTPAHCKDYLISTLLPFFIP